MKLFADLPERVSVYEVSPRDGLQNEAAQVATHAKVRLIEALADAGCKRIEVTSFVRYFAQTSPPDALPKLLAALRRRATADPD